MSYNYLMLEVTQSKELAVAEAVDRLVGCDSSYCPMYYEARKLSRRGPKAVGKAYRANPVVPRFIFITASFPHLGAVLAIRGVVGFELNDQKQLEIIPGWQMAAFMDSVESVRQRALRMAEKLAKPEKPKIVKSFAELAAQMKAQGQQIDPETGEITNLEMAA